MEASANWDDANIKAENFNSRALIALFSAIMNEEFKKISFIETTKEAWTILRTTYEGIKAVKDSKFQSVRTYVFHMLRTYVMFLCNWLIL